MVFFIGSFRRERGHSCVGVYWWAVDTAGNLVNLVCFGWEP